jgi:molybdopterin-guanine dinucleotide biosynthesis protein A
MTNTSPHVGGIILCGGQSSRMGRPKAWLPFGGEVMLQRVVRIVRQAVEPVVVVAAPEQKLPELPADVLVSRDDVPGRGPLQGLSAGLHALEDRAEAAYASGCDVPFLRPEFVRHMIAALGDADIAVPYTDGYHHPLAAVYRTRIVPEVDRLLAADRLRPFFLFEAVPTNTVSAETLREVDPGLDSLRNLNTTADYDAALTEFNHPSGGRSSC